MDFTNPNFEKDLPITLKAYDWSFVHALICRGLKHPTSKGPSREAAYKFFTQIEKLFLNETLWDKDDISFIQKTFY